MSLVRQSTLKRDVVYLRNKLAAAASTPTADLEFKLVSVLKELYIANDTIGKFRLKVMTGRDQIDYN